jgi:hypothetical protein
MFCDYGRLENSLPYTEPKTNKHPTIESPSEAQSLLRQIKQEYHERTVTAESAQVHNLLALRPCACARRRSLWRRRLRRPFRLRAMEVCRRWPSKTTEQQLPQLISRRDEEPSCSTLRNRSLMVETASPIRSTLRAASFILFHKSLCAAV